VRLGRTVWSFHWGSAILALGVAASGHALEAVTANAIVTGTGTAFLVAPDLLVTNRHVIQSCAAVDVYTSEGKRPAQVQATDAAVDLALLRVPGLRGTPVRLRTPRTIRLGETVFVFGFPLSGSLTSGGNFTSGLVSGLRGLHDAPGDIQITAPVQPGNSGGPLLDAAGQVIGVVKAKLDAMKAAKAIGDIPQNVNFAISAPTLVDFLVRQRVGFGNGSVNPTTAPIDTAQVAELAQGFTFRVECAGRGTSPTVVSGSPTSPPNAATGNPNDGAPIKRSGPMTACQGPVLAWTDCFGGVDLPDGSKYVGEFRDGKYHGQGSYLFSDGRRYVGELKDGKRSGQGVFMLLDGTRYIGEYKDDKWNGVGSVYSASGQVLQAGTYDDNRLVRGK
jgi:S1-C subfamily serine protease